MRYRIFLEGVFRFGGLGMFGLVWFGHVEESGLGMLKNVRFSSLLNLNCFETLVEFIIINDL